MCTRLHLNKILIIVFGRLIHSYLSVGSIFLLLLSNLELVQKSFCYTDIFSGKINNNAIFRLDMN